MLNILTFHVKANYQGTQNDLTKSIQILVRRNLNINSSQLFFYLSMMNNVFSRALDSLISYLNFCFIVKF